MSLLSDTSIRAKIRSGWLVKSGDLALASQCAYHFKPGKIFTGGETCEVIDFSNPSAPPFKLKPGAMIWVRMRDDVRIPNDICATWWQTNTLSRKGIMLANMSIVDPGYEGPLACLFVNFGKNVVLIEQDTVMAKLLFHEIDHSVAVPFSISQSLGQYDSDLHSLALNSAGSFLRVDELSTELNVKKQQILEDIAKEAPKNIGWAYVWAALGFAILVAALTFVPWLQEKIKPNLNSEITEAVDRRLMERSTPLPSNSQRELDQLSSSNREILNRLEALDKKLSGPAKK